VAPAVRHVLASVGTSPVTGEHARTPCGSPQAHPGPPRLHRAPVAFVLGSELADDSQYRHVRGIADLAIRTTHDQVPGSGARCRCPEGEAYTVTLREQQAVCDSGCCIGIAGSVYGKAVSGSMCGEPVREAYRGGRVHCSPW
jgi:hypothetical protein